MSEVPLFECRGVEAGYGRVNVVRPFDLAADAGTVVAVLGPNGAGKTTLLSTMAGLLPRQGGSVLVAGHELRSGRAAAASRAGLVLVPDDRSLFAPLSVRDNLRAAAGRRRRAMDDVLDLFPALRERWRLQAAALSGGEQQMLAVARALVQQPKVLLVDEMSMGLAPMIVEHLLPIMRRIADENRAVVVLVEQHVGLALEVADEALVMVHGEVALRGTAADLLRDQAALEGAYLGGEPSEPAPADA
ncbi:MAG TPA: ATP-binding cassette domain-containing protein [Acidimicrobiia bacterium]|nr:ATP-binding cassette domain-containing protein [Acidimicrobiia bacterium]